MAITTNNGLSGSQATQFFAVPEATRQRQYEALRAYFLETKKGSGFVFSRSHIRLLTCKSRKRNLTH